MRILVCGSRSWPAKDYDQVHLALDMFVAHFRDRGLLATLGEEVTIIHGTAAGVDRMADRWARFWELDCDRYPADWAKYGKSAGLVRNRVMLTEGKPDVVIAFRMPGTSRGTDNMLTIARAAGVNNLMLPWNPEGLKKV